MFGCVKSRRQQTLEESFSAVWKRSFARNMHLKALAEIYTLHSFAQLCNSLFAGILPACPPVHCAGVRGSQKLPTAFDHRSPLRLSARDLEVTRFRQNTHEKATKSSGMRFNRNLECPHCRVQYHTASYSIQLKHDFL